MDMREIYCAIIGVCVGGAILALIAIISAWHFWIVNNKDHE